MRAADRYSYPSHTHLMKTVIYLLGSAFLSLSSLTAQTQETWTLNDGRTFEGQVKLVTPGTVIFTRSSGPDVPLEITKLTDASRKRLIEVLGLNAPAAPAPTPTASTPAAATGTKPTMVRNSGAIDATDISMIDSQFGQKATVIGQVKEVVTLGSTGHKRINFENTGFNVFINKRNLEKSSDWKLDDLAGKTVQIEAEVTKYQEQVQMQLTEPSQIKVVN